MKRSGKTQENGYNAMITGCNITVVYALWERAAWVRLPAARLLATSRVQKHPQLTAPLMFS